MFIITIDNRSFFQELKYKDAPLYVYDGVCGLCYWWIKKSEKITKNKANYSPYQEVYSKFPDIPKEDFKKAVKLIYPNGKTYSAAEATLLTVSLGKGLFLRIPYTIYKNSSLFRFISEKCYRVVASHRDSFFKLVKFFEG